MTTLSLHFNGHLSTWIWVNQYQNVAILDFIVAKDDGGGGNNWSSKSCKAPVKLSPPTNQHSFYRPHALPVAQPTVSKHWWKCNNNNNNNNTNTGHTVNIRRWIWGTIILTINWVTGLHFICNTKKLNHNRPYLLRTSVPCRIGPKLRMIKYLVDMYVMFTTTLLIKWLNPCFVIERYFTMTCTTFYGRLLFNQPHYVIHTLPLGELFGDFIIKIVIATVKLTHCLLTHSVQVSPPWPDDVELTANTPSSCGEWHRCIWMIT